MDCRCVERIGAVHDAQEPGRLLERALADARHLQDVAAIPERSVLVAECHDIACDRFVEP